MQNMRLSRTEIVEKVKIVWLPMKFLVVPLAFVSLEINEL